MFISCVLQGEEGQNNWTMSVENSTGPVASTTAHSPSHSLTLKNWGTVCRVVLWMVRDHCSSCCSTMYWLFLEKCEGGKQMRNKIIKHIFIQSKCIGQARRILATKNNLPTSARLVICHVVSRSLMNMFYSTCLSTDPWGKTLIFSLCCKNWTFALIFLFLPCNQLFSLPFTPQHLVALKVSDEGFCWKPFGNPNTLIRQIVICLLTSSEDSNWLFRQDFPV